MSFEQIDKKLDKISDEQVKTTVLMGRMEVDLAHHIKRSDQHEVQIIAQEKKINKIWYVLIAGAAAGISEYGSILLKWLGLGI